MRTVRWVGLVFLCLWVGLFSGCANQDLIYKNQLQGERIGVLENELNAKNLELDLLWPTTQRRRRKIPD